MVAGDSALFGFISYVHFNDNNDNKRISKLHDLLVNEIRAQTGYAVEIFQDRNDIRWGDNWKARIVESLNSATILIPIITPSYFKSPACREEFTIFREREQGLGRDDLIWPIYYISTPLLDDSVRREKDEMARILATRQYVDWRTLRFATLTSVQARKQIEDIALCIRDRLETPTNLQTTQDALSPTTTVPSPLPRNEVELINLLAQFAAAQEEAQRARNIIAETQKAVESQQQEPRTLVVDGIGQGDFTTITDAIIAAKKDDTILIKRGVYEETLHITKSITIIGEGALGDVRIEGKGASTILFQTEYGKISNLWVEQLDTHRRAKHAAIEIASGRVAVEGCYVKSTNSFSLLVKSKDCHILGNQVVESGEGGIHIIGWAGHPGQALVENNDIYGSNYDGISVYLIASAIIRNNRIHNNSWGIVASMHAKVRVEGNVITGNRYSGLRVYDDASMTAVGNHIANNGIGVEVYDDGTGQFERNELLGNAVTWAIRDTDEAKIIRVDNEESLNAAPDLP